MAGRGKMEEGNGRGSRSSVFAHLSFDRDTFDLTMNMRALKNDRLIEVDGGRYYQELAEKEAILAGDYRYYCQLPHRTEAMQWEAMELLLPAMARHYPEHFGLATYGDRWLWTNRLLDVCTSFRFGDTTTLPLPPLDWLGRQVQEDLCLMDGGAGGAPLVAGHLCFAAGWCLDEMLGKSFLAIHAAVPLFAERIGQPANTLMERLKAGRPVGRFNWSITGSDRLNLSPAAVSGRNDFTATVIAADAGDRCFLRSEWQTLSRLPRTGAILFTIHTSRDPLAAVRERPEQAARLAGLLRTMPAAMRGYKGLGPETSEAIVAYLEG